MQRLKYIYRTVVTVDGEEQNVFTEMSVPNTAAGRALAEKEAYNGEITEYDDGQEEEAAQPTTDDVIKTLLGG